MNIKLGSYVLYYGKEYRAVDKGDGTYSLVTHDLNEKKNGFHPHELNPTVLVKEINLVDLDKAYNVYTLAKYKGYTFSARGSKKDGMCSLFTADSSVAEELGFEFLEPTVNWKEVELDQITKLWEELEPIWGFEGETEIRMLKE